MLWGFHTLWVCWVIHTMHCTVSGQANVPNQTQYNAFKCVLDLVSGLCFRGILFPWKSSKNKPQTRSSTLHAATIWHLTNKVILTGKQSSSYSSQRHKYFFPVWGWSPGRVSSSVLSGCSRGRAVLQLPSCQSWHLAWGAQRQPLFCMLFLSQ